jgi:hypothetical protein
MRLEGGFCCVVEGLKVFFGIVVAVVLFVGDAMATQRKTKKCDLGGFKCQRRRLVKRESGKME